MRHSKLAIVFAACFIIAPAETFAQGRSKKEPVVGASREARSQLVRRAFEMEMQTVLDKYLKPHQYGIEVSFDLPQDLKDLEEVPYAPDSIVPDAYQGLPDAKQLEKLQNFKVSIQVPKWIDESTKQTLQTLAQRHLTNKLGRPVPVAMESVALDVEEPKKGAENARIPEPPAAQAPAPVPQPLPAAPAASLASMNPPANVPSSGEMNRAFKEIDDLKNQLQDAQKSALAAAQGAAANGAGAGGGTGNLQAPQQPPQVSTLQEIIKTAKENPVTSGIVVVILYLMAAILVLIPSRSLLSGFKAIQSAFDGLGKSVRTMGESFKLSGGKGEGENSANPGNPTMIASAAEAPKNRGSRDLNTQELDGRIQTMRKNHKPEFDRVAIDVATTYLANAEQAFRAVFLLDMLGMDHARRIFDGMETPAQEKLLTLLKQEANESKVDVAWDIMELYQMRLLTFGWQGGGRSRQLDPEMQRTVSRLTPDDLRSVIGRLNESGIRRILLYLEPSAVAMLLRSVRRNAQSQKILINLIARMPEALADQEADHEIRSQIHAYFTKKQDDLYLPYLQQFEDIIGKVGDDMEDDVIEQLSAANPEIGAYLKKKMVTTAQLFTVSPFERKAVLGDFTNSELAVLLTMFSDDQQKAAIFQIMDDTRRELVMEAFQVMAEESKTALAEKQKAARAHLRQSLKMNRGATASEDSEDTAFAPSVKNGAA